MSNLPSPPRVWTSEQEQVVAAMLVQGLSASTIASFVGLTRNAVIGRIHRNPDLHRHVTRTPGKQTVTLRPKKPKEPIPVIIERPVRARVEPMNPMPLIDTGNRYCKWPIEDNDSVLGGILCCGRLVSFGEVYCRQHLEAARPRRST